jgi:hypothetical protein
MKREKRLTKRERKDADPTRETRVNRPAEHIHCIACGRHIEPKEFTSFPPKSVYLQCDHKHDFPSCAECQVTARYLIAEHERTGSPVQVAQAWH